MKTKRKVVSAKARPKKKSVARLSVVKRRVRAKQPIHKRLALHPINLLFLLCLGVLLSGFTFKSLAASVNITAEIPAPPLTQPAIILQPLDGAQLSPQITTVSGSCPVDSYINLTNNTVFVGTAICAQDGTWSIEDNLNVGQNILSAQDYNVTNSAGPTSPSVTVYYTAPTPPASPSGPSEASSEPESPQSNAVALVPAVSLQVIQVDTDIPFVSPSTTQIVSDQPTLTGVAPPFSLVVIEVHSNPYYCHTYANAQGYWSCTFAQTLPAALHNVFVSAITPSGDHINFAPFMMKVVAVHPKPRNGATKFSITASYTYKIYQIGQPVTLNININGGPAPYAYTVSWGDGSSSTYLRENNTAFNITHTYKWISSSLGAKTIKIEAIDSSGDVSTLQLDAVLRNPAYKVVSNNKPTGIVAILEDIKPWVFILWPGYLIIILMVTAFWLGERQEVIAIVNRDKNKLHHKPKW